MLNAEKEGQKRAEEIGDTASFKCLQVGGGSGLLCFECQVSETATIKLKCSVSLRVGRFEKIGGAYTRRREISKQDISKEHTIPQSGDVASFPMSGADQAIGVVQ